MIPCEILSQNFTWKLLKPTEPDRSSYCSLTQALFQTEKSNIVKTIV